MERNFRVFEDVVFFELWIPDSGFHLLGLSFTCNAKNAVFGALEDSHKKTEGLLVENLEKNS